MLTYSVVSGDAMADAQWRSLSDLFSSEYGTYSELSPLHPGERIRLAPGYYRRVYATPDYRVALCHDGTRLVAEAIYRETETTHGRVALVVQLVVAADCRRQGIASTLLHAIWGFSDYCAWGIVTSNAFTVASLEAATFRRANPAVIAVEREWLVDEVLGRIPFLKEAQLTLDGVSSRVATGFFTDRKERVSATADVSHRLGDLAEGDEWLAIVFRHQEPDDFSAYVSMIDASASFVREAYRLMPQTEQKWALRTADEIDAILKGLPDLPKMARICDFGCGSGRHVRELRRRGYAGTIGVDFATDAGDLVCADCRTWRSDEPLDLILCLYDVIGSFPDDADNHAILDNIAANLRTGGYAVVSVSNWEFLDRAGIGTIDFSDERAAARQLLALRPSSAMADDGEFFDANCILVDETHRLACHKEQFPASHRRLPAEYLIRDRRFTAEEISEWARQSGLETLDRRFARAGFNAEYGVSTGKEILLFLKKAGADRRVSNER